MPFKFKYFIVLTLLFLVNNIAFSAESSELFSTDITKNETQSIEESFKYDFSNTISKFENLNISASYSDFSKLIDTYKDNDFFSVMLGFKTAELGFFDLSKTAFSNINDTDIFGSIIEEIKKYYYPKTEINKENSIILAELYSNIQYNDQIKETLNELYQYPRLLINYDYSNYLMAYGYFKANDFKKAEKYIIEATKNSPNNINYLSLQAKIYASEKNIKAARKILKKINDQKISSDSLVRKINATNAYIDYSTEKNSTNKDFYLGKYYLIEGDYSKALRVLLSSNSKKKSLLAKNYSLICECYLNQGDNSKAIEYAKKSLKISDSNPYCYLVLGDIEFKKGNYKTALNYYKKVSSEKECKKECLEKMANTYLKLSNRNNALDLYKKNIKNFNNSYVSYYNLALLNKNCKVQYLKKSLSINYTYQDAWIDLARITYEKGQYKLGERYLNIAKYLDENNFRYYYYQSLLNIKTK